MSDTDPLSAKLAAIENRGRIAYNDYEAPPRKDWDALVAAAFAILDLHPIGTLSSGQRICVRCCQPGVTVTEGECRERAAIAGALNGTESSDHE